MPPFETGKSHSHRGLYIFFFVIAIRVVRIAVFPSIAGIIEPDIVIGRIEKKGSADRNSVPSDGASHHARINSGILTPPACMMLPIQWSKNGTGYRGGLQVR
jgi:hypothetical protein